jgi:hypothetical protein
MRKCWRYFGYLLSSGLSWRGAKLGRLDNSHRRIRRGSNLVFNTVYGVIIALAAYVNRPILIVPHLLRIEGRIEPFQSFDAVDCCSHVYKGMEVEASHSTEVRTATAQDTQPHCL